MVKVASQSLLKSLAYGENRSETVIRNPKRIFRPLGEREKIAPKPILRRSIWVTVG